MIQFDPPFDFTEPPSSDIGSFGYEHSAYGDAHVDTRQHEQGRMMEHHTSKAVMFFAVGMFAAYLIWR